MIFCNHTEAEHLIDKYDSIEYLVSKLLCTLQLTLLTIELQQVRNQKILEEVSKKFFIWNNYDRIQFQDVVPIQMLAGCTSGISSALIGWNQADHFLIGLHPHYYTHPTIRPEISFYLVELQEIKMISRSGWPPGGWGRGLRKVKYKS